MILQNAIFVPSLNQFLVSTYRHDFVSVKVGNEEVFVDGGRDYLRGSLNSVLTEDYTLSTDSSLEEKKKKLLWGTRGIDGKKPLRWVRLVDCETDHLKNILGICDPVYREVIEAILADR